ncbi:MAG: DUF2231 domain-containing protein [Bacteroidota bacterium]
MDFLASLHPVIIHFPIVLFIVYSIFEILDRNSKNYDYSKIAVGILLAGVLTGMFALLTGNSAAQSAVPLSESAKEILDLHESNATFMIFFYITLAAFRIWMQLKKKITHKIRMAFIILSIFGWILIYNTGNAGAILVFKHAVGVTIPK